jgi:hypothetical protein
MEVSNLRNFNILYRSSLNSLITYRIHVFNMLGVEFKDKSSSHYIASTVAFNADLRLWYWTDSSLKHVCDVGWRY